MMTPSRRTVRLILAMYGGSGLAGGAFGIWAIFSQGTTRLTLIVAYGVFGAIFFGVLAWMSIWYHGKTGRWTLRPQAEGLAESA